MDKSNAIHTIKRLNLELESKHPFSPARLKSTVQLGLKSIWNHRLRSLLTTLGIVFGVCSVIAMLAIGEGASQEQQELIRQMGSNNIIIKAVKPPEEKTSTSQQTYLAEYGITYADVERIKETIPGVQIKVPGRRIRKDVWHRANRVDCEIYGTVPDYTIVNNHAVDRGRFFNDIEMKSKMNVCVLGNGMAEELFPLDSPLGRRVRVGSQYYTVVGTMYARSAGGTSSNDGNSANGHDNRAPAAYRLFIPLTAVKERFGEILMEMQTGSRSFERVELHEVTVQVQHVEDVLEVSEVITAILEHAHKKKDYEIVVPFQQLQAAERAAQISDIVLGGIAALSLLVGGIGIMNIMLASVTERTREIGIRRALGAKRRDIVMQFLVETVLLSSIGGMIGVALGIIIPAFVEYWAEMPTIVTFWSPIMAFSISALVGILFGLYPAFRAANMDPVEALRHE
jgi:putative ABC transport system permease protein